MKARKITVGAILSAVGTVLLYLSGTLGIGRLGLCAAAGLMPYIAAQSCGIYSGCLCYACVSALGFVFVPNKLYAFVFAFCFGMYPLLKIFFDMITSRLYQWTAKIIAANLYFAVIFCFFGNLFFYHVSFGTRFIMLAAAWNAAFIIYDIGISQAMRVYKKRIERNIK